MAVNGCKKAIDKLILLLANRLYISFYISKSGRFYINTPPR